MRGGGLIVVMGRTSRSNAEGDGDVYDIGEHNCKDRGIDASLVRL